MSSKTVAISKFLSYVLRHSPESIGLKLDENGWADVNALIELANQSGKRLSRDVLQEVVAQNDKQRFAFSSDGQRIRANQGHSIDIDLALAPAEPPETLFHGTATRFLDSIRKQGLRPGNRQHVHLSLDVPTAVKVGQRHGTPIVLTIHAARLHRAGRVFFCSENGVWLTAAIAAEDIDFPD